jgi:hypothetical protein
VELNLAEFVVIAVLVAAGCVLGYVGLWFMLRQAATERHEEAKSQLSALKDALQAIEAKVAELSRLVAAPASAPVAEAAVTKEVAQPEKEEVTPETLVVIAAAVTAYLGKKVRIRSAKLLRPALAVANSWSQQGRALIHASHHPRLKG